MKTCKTVAVYWRQGKWENANHGHLRRCSRYVGLGAVTTIASTPPVLSASIFRKPYYHSTLATAKLLPAIQRLTERFMKGEVIFNNFIVVTNYTLQCIAAETPTFLLLCLWLRSHNRLIRWLKAQWRRALKAILWTHMNMATNCSCCAISSAKGAANLYISQTNKSLFLY